MYRLVSLLGGLSVLAAGDAFAQDIDPVGRYTFETVAQGQPVNGILEIIGTTNDWTATLEVPDAGVAALPASTVEVSGSQITITMPFADQGDLLIEVLVDGDDITGSWVLGFDGGDIVGRKTSG